jgi:hypothetical protein
MVFHKAVAASRFSTSKASLKALAADDKAPEALMESEISDGDILQGVIGAIGDLDSPLSPDEKGYASMIQFLSGESATDRQKWRDGILQSSEKDFKDFAERLKRVSEHGSVAVVGSQSALETANAEMEVESKKLKIDKAF